jgi:hypothetical protein
MTVAFIGQRQYFTSCVPHGALFIDHRGGADPGPMLRAVEQASPDVVVVFRPEIVPAGAFDDLDAVTLGFNTEPLPRVVDPDDAHPDQVERLGELAQTDIGQFDRIITFDPLSAEAAHVAGIPVWRSLPLPVADELYVDEVAPMREPPRLLFLGYATEHRERWLVDSKHRFDLLHIAHGVHGGRLKQLFDRTDVAVNLHYDRYLSFENRICLHLAAGHLVLSEPLSPTHGLEPGLDYLEVSSPDVLTETIVSLREYPGIWDATRRRGRRKVEQFRASRMWPRILQDLERDLAAFGTQRRTARTVTSSS